MSNDPLSISRAYIPASVNISIDEAAVLQSFPRDHKFAGTKTKQGLQVGNAVPPLLARRVLEAVWDLAA